MFFEYNGMKLEINNRKKFRKITNMCKLNNILPNNQRVKEETRFQELLSFLTISACGGKGSIMLLIQGC